MAIEALEFEVLSNLIIFTITKVRICYDGLLMNLVEALTLYIIVQDKGNIKCLKITSVSDISQVRE